MNITTKTYGATVNANKSWWRATLTADKLNGKKEIEKPQHENPQIQAIHDNANLTREEKIALAKKILNGEKKATENKSKVCVIANNLIKQGLNRSEAFRKAWAIVKQQSIETKIAGVSYGNRQKALERLTQYDAEQISINLLREADNEFDNNAIAVIVSVKDKGSYNIGYLPRKLAEILLYKDARCDMNILDDVIGSYNWKRQHTRDNANCIVSIYDENKKEWISKEDTGTASNAEAEKGLASDSFKRACFNWGIGRELYTAPFIWVNVDKVNWTDKNGKKTTYDTFSVSKIEYTDKIITSLEITNQNKNIVYSMKNIPQQNNDVPEQKAPITPPQKIICSDCQKEIIDLKHNGTIKQATKIKEYSEKQYGRCLCWTCQKKQKGLDKINTVA